jgi:hypothetical protein
MPHPRRSTQHF